MTDDALKRETPPASLPVAFYVQGQARLEPDIDTCGDGSSDFGFEEGVLTFAVDVEAVLFVCEVLGFED
ncbi:hypothetical protein, partial [Niveispirillum cyanobacteriorum]|uniref:hypothetical protein n=1 Tax=Niveispirillum cyanobacteriorum TaxID=1612173 RepID=UPI00166574A4